jgi:hydrogenase maturation protease
MDDEQGGRPLVIGMGNTYRCDDALGILVARELARRHPGRVRVIEARGEGAELVEVWKGESVVVVVDAVSPGKSPGRICRVDALRAGIEGGLFLSSSHQFGLAEAVALSKRLCDLPESLMVYGIEGQEYGAGVGLSDPVVKSLPKLMSMIEEDLRLGQPC